MKENFNFCKRIALGGLLQGYFHNLRGTLQGISLELQLILMKKDLDLNKEIYERVNKALNLLQKLQNQINTAFDEIYNEKTGPWDLKEIIEKEILFWEAFMPFKHKVKKEIFEEEKVLIEVPYNLLKGLFCNICQEIFLNLKENTHLKIFIKKNKRVEFLWDKDLDNLVYENLKDLSYQLKNLADIKVDKRTLTFQF
uniref:Histidine kinase n=1 Tax=Thermodesulfobacterium geofontis TaxID=1295609 RepID=A0A7V4JPS6_9BACT